LTVAIISLDQHDLFRYIASLLDSAESQQTASPRIGIPVSKRGPHTSSYDNIEPSEFTILAHNGDESEIVGEHVYIIARGYGDGNFKLKTFVLLGHVNNVGKLILRTFLGK
jgi:hypothetical protein